ncbi:RNA polymerase-associated protein RapA [Microcystis aeruginosa Sj]|uniref:RNA polymerase-associated protein RapA n=1 Tax=Microcystis aeruginosa Sj TaxID=1979544 RepID=A0A2Z6UNZ9_MICAE|nr:helicase-related protein [Microcystis aeruginosa]GBL11062.1 RNA polymerase-associated protein RapA [Microcystis aeruginosa Sj]
MLIPDYIDNSTHTLETILKQLIEDENQHILDIATGFFRIEAWLRLEETMNRLTSFRLLIGRDPAIRPAESDRIDLIRYFRRNIQEQLEGEPFKREYKNQIDRVIAYLQQDHVKVRLFGALGEKSQFLHAKAYIFDHYSIVGSSNFTPAGLQGNTELNIINKVGAIASDLRQNWFEKFWNDPSVDLDYKTKLIDALNASKFGSKAYTPYQVFLKALYELFKDEAMVGETERTTLELASFQQEGFERAVKLMEKHRGCIVADAVGLGKTYIGLRVLDYYLIKLRRPGYVPRALVVCPAQLRDLVWIKKLDEFGIKADVLSHEEISRQNFDLRRFSQYDLVVVDEGHNFRNSATNRYRNLLKMVSSGKRNKRVLLLTATPINNSVFDLYHQISLLTRGNDTYYREDGISNLKTYFKALAKGGVEITELLFQTMVRRSRQDVIRRQMAGEEIRINNQLIHFPKRELEQFTYNFEGSFTGLYAGIADRIDQLHLAPYNIKAFKRKKQKQDEDEVKRNDALVALQKALYLKRLESSLIAFKNSVRNQRDFQSKFYEILTQQGKLLSSKNFRKLILAAGMEEEDAEKSMSSIISQLEEIDHKDYQIDNLRAYIESDLAILNGILTILDKIQQSVAQNQDHDRKLAAFKELLKTNLKSQRILVFSYFKDTADYLHSELLKDEDWLKDMGNPAIELITGDTPGKQREEKVKRFSPKANTQEDNELETLKQNPIDILICTDVLSEGQNLQDAGVLVNYDLHWNPVRMIQRAGRIDRLGTDYDTLYIYNCFPEEGLEALLNLVRRLQDRIATIDREVGLDASVLGETIQERSLEELYRLKQADTEAEKAAILEELEQTADLVSLDEMRLPLLEFIQQKTREAVEEIPLGIHSTRTFKIPDHTFSEGGLFLAFKAGDRHFWQFYPSLRGHISTEPSLLVTDKRKIFNWIKCKESDFPPPEDLPPVQFDTAIFRILTTATNNLLKSLRRQHTSHKLKPSLSKLIQKIHHALIQPNLLENQPDDQKTKVQILQVINTVNLKIYERDIKTIWDKYVQKQDLNTLIAELDEYFVDNDLYNEIEEKKEESPLKIIREEDIQLVCYEWFKPE